MLTPPYTAKAEGRLGPVPKALTKVYVIPSEACEEGAGGASGGKSRDAPSHSLHVGNQLV